jgi:hypothetical protein
MFSRHAAQQMVNRPHFFLLLGMLLWIAHAQTDYSIEWIDNTIELLDEQTIVLHFEYRVANIQECNTGGTDSCLFRPTVHAERPDKTACSADPLTMTDVITVRPVIITTSSVNVYVQVDVLAAADANVPGLIVDDVLSICVQLNSYAVDGALLVNSFEVIQRATLNITGSFVLARPVTTEAFDQIRDIGGNDGDAFQIPIVVSQCSDQQPPVQQDNNNDGAPILELCVTAANPEFTSVSSLMEVKLERPATMAVQTVIDENGAAVDPASTALECSSGRCRIRSLLDLEILGQETGTLRFYGRAVLSVGAVAQGGSGRQRLLGSATETQQHEQLFDYEFQLLIPKESSASSFAPPPIHDWCKGIILLVTISALVLYSG